MPGMQQIVLLKIFSCAVGVHFDLIVYNFTIFLKTILGVG